jgi:hypothetical protein
MSKQTTTPGTLLGDVLVLGQTPERKRSCIVYRLKCLLCGREFTEILPDIKRGKQSSCNCRRKEWERSGTKNWRRLAGVVKGFIRLIQPTLARKAGGYIVWDAECLRCGRYFTISTDVLRHSVSCGCYRREVEGQLLARYRDIYNELRCNETKIKFQELQHALEDLKENS